MIKQTFSVGAILLVFGVVFGGTPVFAEDDASLPGNNARVETNCIGNSDMNCSEAVPTSDNVIDEPVDIDEITDCEEGTEGVDCGEVITVGPVEGDPQETCTEDDEDCVVEEEETEEESEPAAWPMYVSLGALGAAIVVFIVLNLFGGKKK